MKPRDLIHATLIRLDKSIHTKVPIIVIIKEKLIADLLKTLEEEKIVTIIIRHNNTCTVKVSANVSEIRTTSIITKARQLKLFADHVPENNKGKLLLTTSKGLITHHAATKKNIGGEIIGTIY